MYKCVNVNKEHHCCIIDKEKPYQRYHRKVIPQLNRFNSAKICRCYISSINQPPNGEGT